MAMAPVRAEAPSFAAAPVKGTVELPEEAGAVDGEAEPDEMGDETGAAAELEAGAEDFDEAGAEDDDEDGAAADDDDPEDGVSGTEIGTPTPAHVVLTVSATAFWSDSLGHAFLTHSVTEVVSDDLAQWHLKSVMDEQPSPDRAVRKQDCEHCGMLGSWAFATARTAAMAATEYFMLTVGRARGRRSLTSDGKRQES